MRLYDLSEAQLNAASHYVDTNKQTYVDRLLDGKKQKSGSCEVSTNLAEAVKDAWLVVEAVPEVQQVKIDTFEQLDKLAPEDCILATNSSSFKSRVIIDKVDPSRRRRCCNVHFQMPPDLNVVELMTCGETDEQILPFLAEQLKKTGLEPVICQAESTGLLFNRIWAAIKRECLMVLSEGVSTPEQIDHLFARTGMKLLPCAGMDAVGLDTVASIEQHYVKERGLDDTHTVKYLEENFLRSGRLGAKSGKGGLYPPGALTKHPTEIDHSASEHNSAAPTLYFLDIGMGEDVKSAKDVLTAGRVCVGFPDGRDIRPIIEGLTAPDGIEVDVNANKIYWTNMGMPGKNDGTIKSASLDGSDAKSLLPQGAVNTPKQIALDSQNQKLYFSDREGLRVHRCNLDGSDHEIILRTGDLENPEHMKDQTRWCVGMYVDAKRGKFYWTQKGGTKAGQGRIFRANIEMPEGATPENRPDVELLFDHLPECIDLDLDLEKEVLYWSDRGEFPVGNTINRAYVGDGSPPEGIATGSKYHTLVRHLHEAIGVKIDTINKHIYFCDLGGAVYRCRLDGSEKKKVYDTDFSFSGLALAFVH